MLAVGEQPVHYGLKTSDISGREPTLRNIRQDTGQFRLGKGIVYGKDTPNFVANRIGVHGMMATIHQMTEDGLTVEEYLEFFSIKVPDGALTSGAAPIMRSIVPLIFLLFLVPGVMYGVMAGTVVEALERAARADENLVPHILTAVKAWATVGEISDVLREMPWTCQLRSSNARVVARPMPSTARSTMSTPPADASSPRAVRP